MHQTHNCSFTGSTSSTPRLRYGGFCDAPRLPESHMLSVRSPLAMRATYLASKTLRLSLRTDPAKKGFRGVSKVQSGAHIPVRNWTLSLAASGSTH